MLPNCLCDTSPKSFGDVVEGNTFVGCKGYCYGRYPCWSRDLTAEISPEELFWVKGGEYFTVLVGA